MKIYELQYVFGDEEVTFGYVTEEALAERWIGMGGSTYWIRETDEPKLLELFQEGFWWYIIVHGEGVTKLIPSAKPSVQVIFEPYHRDDPNHREETEDTLDWFTSCWVQAMNRNEALQNAIPVLPEWAAAQVSGFILEEML